MPSPRTPPHSPQPRWDTVGQSVLPSPSQERPTRWGPHLLPAHPSSTLREPSAGPRHGRCRPGPRGSGQGWAEPGTDMGRPLPCVPAVSPEWAPQAARPQRSPSGRPPHTRVCVRVSHPHSPQRFCRQGGPRQARRRLGPCGQGRRAALAQALPHWPLQLGCRPSLCPLSQAPGWVCRRDTSNWRTPVLGSGHELVRGNPP